MAGHPRIQRASLADQSWLQAQLEAVPLSHLDQLQDHRRFQRQGSGSLDSIKYFQTPRTSHYIWSHPSAANHASCAVSFAFYSCRLASESGGGADPFTNQ